jgi:PAS domain S-box-containing protein
MTNQGPPTHASADDDEIESTLRTWRVKALSVLLIVVAVAGLPSYGLSIITAIHNNQLTPLLLIYPAVYLAIVVLAFLPRLDFRAKAVILFALAYTNAVASFARLGLIGSSRLYLLVVPVIAVLFISARAGYITAAISLLIYSAFALLAHFGVLASWITEPTNPMTLAFWLDAGLSFATFMIIVVVLLERFYTLQVRTLAAKQQASVKLAQTAEALREREERLALVLQGTNDGLWDWDLKTNAVYYSPRWKSMLGYEDHEIANRFESWRDLIHPDDVERALAQVQANQEGRGPAYELEHRLRHKDGSYRWILARGLTLRDDQGDPYRMLGAHTDITEQKRAQEALRLANQTLEQHVEERTKELATLNAIAAVVSRSLDLEEILSAALDKTMEVIGTEAGAAYRLEEANQELILMTQRGLSDDFVISTTHLALEVALAGKTVNASQPLIWDIARDYPESELKQQIQREGLQFIVGVPLLAKHRLVGSLVLSTHAMRTLTPEESSMLIAIGQQVGVAVENARLFEERTRRVNNLSQLYQANLALSASVELDEVLRHVSRVAREISEADAVSLYIYDEATDSFTQAHALGVTGNWSPTHIRRAGMTRRVIHEVTPILVNDTLDNPEVNPHTVEAGLRSLIATPLISQGKPVGVIYVGSFSPHRFDADDVQWVSALANQAAVAIANARLYEAERARHAEAERRRQVAEGLREILAALNSRQSLEETLDFIVSQACRLMRCDAASILQLQSDGWLKIRSACGLDADYVANMRMPFGGGGAGRALAGHQPVTLSDARVFAAALARESDAAAGQELAAIERTMNRGYYALLSVPVIIKDEDYGAITLYYREAREFSEEESRLASSVAHQAALAIESARLREQAELSAAMAERSRLARELHDSVTQSLYSITLYAEAAARLLAMGKNTEAADHLRELRDTSQEALREMRLLIFELRPLALEKSGLVAALQARLDAVEVRGGMQAELQVEGQEQLPHVVQEELYHITQEALNNVLKHAKARHVKVHVQFSEAGTSLEVCDDGVGFDPAMAYAQGGLGLRGMTERAQKIGAALNIESAPDKGTQVCIQVSAQPHE